MRIKYVCPPGNNGWYLERAGTEPYPNDDVLIWMFAKITFWTAPQDMDPIHRRKIKLRLKL